MIDSGDTAWVLTSSALVSSWFRVWRSFTPALCEGRTR